MQQALVDRTRARPADRLFGIDDARTLDDLLVEVLYDVSRGDPVACPVCGVPALASTGEDLVECRSCGTRLESG
jgi:tRNA(Ile2) C34 agmatinyltransferase TiaS